MEDDKIFDKISELLSEGIARFDSATTTQHSIDTEQPARTSWVVFDVGFKGYGTDAYAVLSYDNDLIMHLELIRLTSAVFTPELLRFIRSGEILNLTLRIGPDTLGGLNLNEENDIESADLRLSESV